MTPYGYGYQPPAWPAPPLPPQGVGVGVKVLAGFQCFFGGLGVLYTPFAVFQMSFARDAVSKAIYEAMWHGPAAIWSWFQLLVGIALAGIELASGIGLFMSKRWARTLGLVYGGAALVMLVAGQIVTFVVLAPVLDSFRTSSNPIERAAAMGGMIGGIVGAFFGAILPVTMLIVLGRKAIVPQLRD